MKSWNIKDENYEVLKIFYFQKFFQENNAKAESFVEIWSIKSTYVLYAYLNRITCEIKLTEHFFFANIFMYICYKTGNLGFSLLLYTFYVR